jgi:hypothetical protein
MWFELSEQPEGGLLLAGRLAALVTLLDVRTLMLHAELLDPASTGPFVVALNITPSVAQEGDLLLYEFGYEVAVRAGASNAADQDESGLVATISTRHLVVYKLPSSENIPDEQLHAFGSVSALLTAHPYVREAVQSITVRMGLPAITLDVLKVPWALPDAAVQVPRVTAQRSDTGTGG